MNDKDQFYTVTVRIGNSAFIVSFTGVRGLLASASTFISHDKLYLATTRICVYIT